MQACLILLHLQQYILNIIPRKRECKHNIAKYIKTNNEHLLRYFRSRKPSREAAEPLDSRRGGRYGDWRVAGGFGLIIFAKDIGQLLQQNHWDGSDQLFHWWKSELLTPGFLLLIPSSSLGIKGLATLLPWFLVLHRQQLHMLGAWGFISGQKLTMCATHRQVGDWWMSAGMLCPQGIMSVPSVEQP